MGAEESQNAEEAFNALPGESVSAAPAIPKRRGRRSNAELAAEAGVSVDEYKAQRQAAGPAAGKTITVKPKRIIPTDKGEFEKVIRPYKVPAALGVKLLDRMCKQLDVSPLDAEEKDLATDATAALMYEEVEVLSGRFLFLCAMMMIAVPRAMEAMDKRKAKREAANKAEELQENTQATLRLMKEKQGQG